MKKFNFKTRLKKDNRILDKLCLSLLGFVCMLFCGCSSTISEDPQSDKPTDDLVLASFAKEHQALVKSLLQGSGINGSDETEASEDSVRVAGIISKIEGNSCIGGPIGAAAGVALATYQLDNCLDDALYHYRNCK